jgi:plasmid stabilization system protein ParE
MREAARRYEGEAEGLGDRFLDAVSKNIRHISEFPYAGKEVGELRAIAVRSFPYSVFYGTDEDEVVIVAVAHYRKRPGYWLKRKI